MQSNPRIVVKLLVILVKTLVNLLVKLTKLGWRNRRFRRGIRRATPSAYRCFPPGSVALDRRTTAPAPRTTASFPRVVVVIGLAAFTSTAI